MDVKHDNDHHHHRNKIIKYSLSDSVTTQLAKDKIENDELDK